VYDIKMELTEIRLGGKYRIDLTQNRDNWKAALNTVCILDLHKMLGSSCVTAQLVASQKGLVSWIA
jgi:hypothetical protein